MEQREVRQQNAVVNSRGKRRRRKKKSVKLSKSIIAIIGVVIICCGSLTIWAILPGIQVSMQLNEASQYVKEQSYEEAIASCEEALNIDSKSVKAYKAMAGIYLSKEDRDAAEQTLYSGWETTGDENLLKEYCIHLLNDAVADINGGNCSLATLDKCIQAMEQGEVTADCYRLLDACFEKLFLKETELFCNMEVGCSFDLYVDIMNRLLDIYETTPSDELKSEVQKFILPQNPKLIIEVKHLQEYQKLLARASEVVENEKLNELIACIDKAKWVQDTFSDAFEIFDSGEFAAIKDFMQTETYISIRDDFINGTMEYWDGQTYIPVSREKLILSYIDNHYKFSFADYEECPDTAGIIQVWGTKQEDAGVLRLCIAYEPASVDGEYYPHTTYEFIYLYSNVQIDNKYVPQMNYRFETRVATPEGTTTQLVGDWGGEHEWTTEY